MEDGRDPPSVYAMVRRWVYSEGTAVADQVLPAVSNGGWWVDGWVDGWAGDWTATAVAAPGHDTSWLEHSVTPSSNHMHPIKRSRNSRPSP